MALVVMRQFAGAPEAPSDLQEAVAHQVGAARNREKHDPHRQLKIGRYLFGVRQIPDKPSAERADHAGKKGTCEQSEED